MSFYAIKTLSLLAFISCNLLTLFFLRDRTNLVINAIFCCLFLILFFASSASNYATFREITISLIAFFTIAIMTLASRDETPKNSTIFGKKNYKKVFIVAAAAVIFCIAFLLLKNMPKITESIAETKQIITTTNAENSANYNTKLINHSLLKHYSDAVLIIISVATCALISLQKTPSKKNNS